MAEKKIIELNQTGDRVKELLDQIDATYDETKANAETAINTANAAKTSADEAILTATSTAETVADLGEAVGSQGISIADHESRISIVEGVAAAYDLTYSDDILRLRQTRGDVTEVVSEVKIVSASDVVSSVINVTRITPANDSVTLDEPGAIEYNVESLQGDVETGDLTVVWRVNNTVVLTETVQQGKNTFKLDGRVSAGTNRITATFVDSLGTSLPMIWNYTVIDMYISSSFNDTTTYSGNANIVYTAYGSVSKTVYFLLNGEEIYKKENITTTGVQESYILEHQPHGAYALEIYCKATLNSGREIESKHLYYDVMFIDDDNLTPIIRWPYSGENLTQYKATAFEYSVYTPNSLTSDIKLYIDDKLVSSQTVDRTEQEWIYKPQQAEEKVVFTIKTGEVEKQKVLDIEKFPYDINPISGAAFDFNPTGKTNNDLDYNSWTDGTYSLSVDEGFDWINGGWKQDENNDTYFCVKAGSRAYLNFPLFQTRHDVKSTGKNFKIIFKTTNNRSIKDTAISCLASKMITNDDGSETLSKIGVQVGTQEANLYAATKEIEVQYVENEKIELEFNITQAGDRKNLILGYINADPVRVIKYDSNASFNTADYQYDVPITIGNDTCDVHIYRIKCYNMELTDKDIMQNYIADSTNSDDMIARYERNDILDESGENLDYNKLSKLYPDLRIILLTCPRFTFDKDDKVKGCTVQHIMGNGDPMHNWTATNVQIKGQGTSSNEYGTSARNIDIKLNKVKIDGVEQNYTFTYGDNTTTGSKYAMTENSIPVNYFNIKVNVASSENANNACLAERFFQFNPYVRQARIDNPKVRDTMEFHPCVIFLKELGTDTEYGNQEFEDTKDFHFYACGDFGNSKKNHEAFGMDLAQYDDYLKAAKEQNTDTPVDSEGQPMKMPTEAILEISNNSAAGCRFKFAEGWDEILPDEDPTPTWNEKDQKWVYLDIWGGDVVEFRYPEDLFDVIENKDKEFNEVEVSAANRIFNSLKGEVRRLWNWVASTDTSIEGLSEEEIQARKEKFKNEYTQYFEPQSLLYNYLFTDRYLMIDNRAKNVFLHTVDGLIWDLCFDYDNDTSLGCDNRGTLKYEYYYEDTDKFGSENVYNAADSVLWCNVRDCLFSELGEVYRNNQFRTAQGTLTAFNDYQAYKPERLQMFDMRRKYLRPYTDGHYASNKAEGKTQSFEQYLPMLNGRKKYQRQAFETYREAYTNSKYEVVNDSKALSFRAKANGNSTISITPYCWLYVHVDYDGPDFGPIRTEANQPVTVTIPIEKLDDTNTHIYHPEWIKAVDGLDQWYIRNANFDSGTRLTKLILGSDAPGYENKKDEDHTIAISNARLLEELNVCGWKMPNTWNLDLSGNTNLKKLHATNANISSISFANGGLVEEVKVDYFSAISAVNLKNLHTFEVKSLTPVTKVRIENTPIISASSFLEQCTNLLRLRLVGVDWALADAQLLDKFIVLSGIDENGADINKYEGDKPVPGGSVVAGKAFVETIKESQLWRYEEDWPNLSITYGTKIEQFMVTYLDWDNSILYEGYVDRYGTPIDPVEQGLIPAPTKEPSAQYTYEFAGWDGDLTSPVQSPRTLQAVYTPTIRRYTVRWFKNTIDRDPLYVQEFDYGSDAVFGGELSSIQYNDAIRAYNLFKGWSKSTSFITGDIDVYALWESGDYILEEAKKDTLSLSAAQIYTAVQRGEFKAIFQDPETNMPNGDRINVQMGYKPEFENLSSTVLIDQPTYFDGKTIKIFNDIKLFEEDRDWTLLIDAKFDDEGVNGSTLLSCGYGSVYPGLSIQYTTISHGPAFTYGANSTGGDNRSTQRDIYMITHKQGSADVEVYIGDLQQLKPTKKILTAAIIPNHNFSLVLGGEANKDGEGRNYFHGVIFNTTMWNAYLGGSDCELICTWPRDTYQFDVAGYEGYAIENDRMTYVDFVAAQLMPYNLNIELTSSTNVSYFDTKINKWLEERLYNAISHQWRAILCSAKVKATVYPGNSIISQYKHLWIPSADELFNNNSYADEGENKAIYTSNDSRRFAFNAAMKEFYPGSISELQQKDWCYVQTTDPMLDPSIRLENGDMWYNNSKYYIYKDFVWYLWGQSYHLRSVSTSGKLGYVFDTGGVTLSNSFDTARAILPVFSLKRN